jgi:hypothetical protein
MTDQLAVAYKGTEPFPGGSRPPRTFEGGVRVAVTIAIVTVPFGGLAVAVWLAWGHGLRLADILLAAAFYLVTGLGVTVGFHRQRFLPGARCGSGCRSPRAGRSAAAGTPRRPPCCGPGLVRVTVLQHVTWSVNSLCHVIGARPFTTRRCDRATNLWPLALLSLGESWHNMHHSDPACARHGADPGQVDVSAAVIRVFERLGWATGVHWPVPARMDSRRRDQGQPSIAGTQHSEALLPPASRLTVNTVHAIVNSVARN